MTTTPPPAVTAAPPSSAPTPSVRVASWRMVTQSERSVIEAVDPASVDADAVRTSLHTALGVAHACVSVEAVHADGLMGRIAALINPFPVIDFAYHRSADGDRARAALCLEGTPWQIERVAQKIRRVVGVLVVHSDPTGHDS